MSNQVYYLDSNREVVGPFDADQVPALLESRLIGLQTLVAEAGTEQWKPVADLWPSLNAAPHSAEPSYPKASAPGVRTRTQGRRHRYLPALGIGAGTGAILIFGVMLAIPNPSEDSHADISHLTRTSSSEEKVAKSGKNKAGSSTDHSSDAEEPAESGPSPEEIQAREEREEALSEIRDLGETAGETWAEYQSKMTFANGPPPTTGELEVLADSHFEHTMITDEWDDLEPLLDTVGYFAEGEDGWIGPGHDVGDVAEGEETWKTGWFEGARDVLAEHFKERERLNSAPF